MRKTQQRAPVASGGQSVADVTGCKICGRVKWGEWVPIPGGRWRHSECSIGSEAYRAYYAGLSDLERATIGPWFDFSYPKIPGEGEST